MSAKYNVIFFNVIEMLIDARLGVYFYLLGSLLFYFDLARKNNHNIFEKYTVLSFIIIIAVLLDGLTKK